MLSTEQLVRYSRHIRLQEVGQAGQEKLTQARVLIIGMGGLGSPVGLYLAAAGVGTLGLAEFDAVEVHNLQRQIMHTNASVGKHKLDSAIERIQALNPDVNLISHPEGINCDNAVELIQQYDIVVDGTDNFPTRYLVNDAAFFAQRPLVYGSIFQFEGQASFFNPNASGPCYRCLFPNMPEPGSVPNCEQAGVFGALCGVVGSLQSMEAIKHIAGIGQSLSGRLLVFDGLNMQTRTLKLKKDPSCPLCGKQATIQKILPTNYEFFCEIDNKTTTKDPSMSNEYPIEISVSDTDKFENADFLDVREDFEVDICKVENTLHIPLGKIGEQYTNLPKDKPLIVYCHHGMRSLRATEFLRQQGFDKAMSMMGGIDAWALEKDTSMARY